MCASACSAISRSNAFHCSASSEGVWGIRVVCLVVVLTVYSPLSPRMKPSTGSRQFLQLLRPSGYVYDKELFARTLGPLRGDRIPKGYARCPLAVESPHITSGSSTPSATNRLAYKRHCVYFPSSSNGLKTLLHESHLHEAIFIFLKERR
jgi:hypothetical protein